MPTLWIAVTNGHDKSSHIASMASTSKPGNILNDNMWGIVYAINIYKLA
jgi:hypothetical protein